MPGRWADRGAAGPRLLLRLSVRLPRQPRGRRGAYHLGRVHMEATPMELSAPPCPRSGRCDSGQSRTSSAFR
ncbi:hypothetical protein ADL25_13130 [Streptomyces sp. NRRL F-5122]|nr:hypothetical protein ADL25_13130 [Streptomyces sp. NRRL F-5122]